jgi:hypothetical protein
MLLKGNPFRNYHNFILFSRKTYQQRWTFRSSIYRLFIPRIYDHQPPLRFLLCNPCKLIESLKHSHPFLSFQRKILHYYLSISLTCKFNMTKIPILQLGMICYYPIMNQENFSLLVEMRMRVTIYLLPAGCPARMCDSTCCKSSLWHDLVDNFIYAACLLQSMLGIFDQSTLIAFPSREGEDSSTIVASIFQ